MKKQQIITRTKYWQNKLGLHNWKINIFFKNFHEDIDSDSDRFGAVAKTDLNPTYLIADITFKEQFLIAIQDDTILHELLHLIFGEVISYVSTTGKKLDKGWITHFEEKTVTTIERVITRIHKV